MCFDSAGREASNNSHRSRHSSTFFLNSGCIRRMMRGVSSLLAPLSLPFLSPPFSPEADYYRSPAASVCCFGLRERHYSPFFVSSSFNAFPSPVIAKRFQYFSNNQPFFLDYSILIVPPSSTSNLSQLLVFGNN